MSWEKLICWQNLLQLIPDSKINALATRKQEERRQLDHYMDGWPTNIIPSSTDTWLHIPAPSSSIVESNKTSIISLCNSLFRAIMLIPAGSRSVFSHFTLLFPSKITANFYIELFSTMAYVVVPDDI